MRGRLGSLIEEKNQLSKKIQRLEESNKLLSNQVEELQNTAKDVEVQTELGSAVHNEPNANVMDRDDSEVSTTKESGPMLTEEAHLSVTGEPNMENVETFGAKSMDDRERLEEYDYVFLCDSNGKFINTQLLCPNSTVKVIPCGTSSQAIKIISSPRFKVNKALIINTGVNDVEHLKIDEVIQKQLEMVEAARKAFPEKRSLYRV